MKNFTEGKVLRNAYDNFTLNSIFRPKAFIKKKHATLTLFNIVPYGI